jgi:hypothetical protein
LPPLTGALNGALKEREAADWIDEMFWDDSGFLKQYRDVVHKLLIRDREVRLWIEKGLSQVQAENIAEPSKPAIVKMHGASLSTVQNVHRVMRETNRLLHRQAA